jgi:putative radical SAM enzyme (TIGR03279 family)
MSLIISRVCPDSLADLAGIKAGDILIEINNNPIADFLDLQFYSSEDHLDLRYKRNDQLLQVKITNDWSSPLGIEPESHKCRICTNDCIFCFVDQMPKGLRTTLNIKDDDYRLSFVYGNFVTLTNLTARDYRKIFEKKISPLYISVHTTDPILHKKILRYKKDFDIMDQLRKLSKEGIQLHTQIVVIPSWNDGRDLKKTLDDLHEPDLKILSVGIVPVGLTRFRRSLTPLSTVSPAQAFQILRLTEKYERTYCSDEIYLLSNEEIPSEEFYDGYPQLENGIGMMRLFLDNWKLHKTTFIDDLKKTDLKPVFICGNLVKPFMQRIINEIRSVSGIDGRVVSVDNDFFGHTVTVTGLLTGRDIIDQIDINKDEVAVLSNGIFNPDGLTIDNLSRESLCMNIGNKVIIADEDFSDWEIRI